VISKDFNGIINVVEIGGMFSEKNVTCGWEFAFI